MFSSFQYALEACNICNVRQALRSHKLLYLLAETFEKVIEMSILEKKNHHPTDGCTYLHLFCIFFFFFLSPQLSAISGTKLPCYRLGVSGIVTFLADGKSQSNKQTPSEVLWPELNMLFPLALWPMHMAKDNIQYTIVCQSARQLNKSIVAVILTF